MARGGRRAGVQGRNYANRTDLSMNARPLPVQTATGQQYGKAGEQAAGQSVVPLAPPPTASQPGSPPAAPERTGPAYTPGQHDFGRASERPDEPITAMPDTKPGGGGLATALMVLARQSGSADLAELARQAQTMSP